MREAMVTTIDNPYNPFEDFDSWQSFDVREGHHTLSYLARIVVVSDEMSRADYELAVEHAVDEIIDYNLTGMYKKVTREVPDFE
jgi:hypothetical protein